MGITAGEQTHRETAGQWNLGLPASEGKRRVRVVTLKRKEKKTKVMPSSILADLDHGIQKCPQTCITFPFQEMCMLKFSFTKCWDSPVNEATAMGQILG